METILKTLANYYIIFIFLALVGIFAIIGYFIEKKHPSKKVEEPKLDMEAVAKKGSQGLGATLGQNQNTEEEVEQLDMNVGPTTFVNTNTVQNNNATSNTANLNNQMNLNSQTNLNTETNLQGEANLNSQVNSNTINDQNQINNMNNQNNTSDLANVNNQTSNNNLNNSANLNNNQANLQMASTSQESVQTNLPNNTI